MLALAWTMVSLVLKWVSLICFMIVSTAIGTCEELTVKSCINAGYKYTAKYPKIKGKSFQAHKGELLDVLIPPLTCSPYSSLILCSLFLPKCVPGSGRPMLPCRQVCLDFTDKCKVELQLASTLGMTIALCDLLPVYDGNANKCIMPKKFLISSTTQLSMCAKHLLVLLHSALLFWFLSGLQLGCTSWIFLASTFKMWRMVKSKTHRDIETLFRKSETKTLDY